MLELKRIGVTGGVASGKSSVCQILEGLGARVVSADKIVHKLLSHNTNIRKRVIALLGENIVENKIINRKIVANKVFNDPQLLLSLEAILHPAVKEVIQQEYDKTSPPYTLFVAEVPLLYEAHMEDAFDTVIAVTADPQLCQQRLPHDYSQRVQRQLPQEEKAARANIVIENNGTLTQLKNQVINAYNKILS